MLAIDAQTLKMHHSQNLIQSLIELREHHQTIQLESDRAIAYTIEQINHVNALLVDQLLEDRQLILQRKPPQSLTCQLVESLLKLRSHYQTLHSQHQQQAQIARQQIAHVNALLAEQAVTQYSEPHSTIQADVEPKHLNEALTAEIADEQIEAHSEPAASTSTTTAQQTTSERSQHLRSLKTPLQPQYQHLTKSEAVEQLLHENKGSVLHIDYIIRALHGALDLEELRAEKPRMNDTLRKGVEKGLWNKVPDAAGCYTIDMAAGRRSFSEGNLQKALQRREETSATLADRKPMEQASTTENASESLSAAVPLLPRYQQMSFTKAVATVVQENAGEVLTPETVARALYGELEAKTFTQAKAKVGKTLWNGAKQGRWQSVPGKLGKYTLR